MGNLIESERDFLSHTNLPLFVNATADRNAVVFRSYWRYTAAQHGLQATPLARPHTRRVFQARRVPLLASVYTPASGALEAQRWAARIP